MHGGDGATAQRALEALGRDALEAYSSSYKLTPNPALHYNRARAFEALGRYETSIASIDPSPERRASREIYRRFLGFVGDEELPALYAGAEAFCFTGKGEGFGLPILESMACRTPPQRGCCRGFATRSARSLASPCTTP